ncbi:AAA family ATPase [Micromonospora sp. R77]|uniref:AAA family ATPase n=1 Tax=Micromonospora sp. R77 TaxID=2925836 RepID=UPI001F601374|nr:AAA family ATPase [Micromonospora sp. R77]MCI4061190.1 AAA family ATPase [Micromonospora sp. R77]
MGAAVGDAPAVPALLPVLWLCGPSGVGKSTIAWELFTGLPGSGHVDIDQVGMCFPELPSDPGRTVLEGRILGRVVANFAAAGAGCLIVSGYVDSRRGVHTGYLRQAVLTVLRMRCDQPELRRRLEIRARPGERRESALREAELLDRSSPAYRVLDTTGRTAVEVLEAVRARWPKHPARQPGPWPDPPRTPGEILWLCGATAVGKSTIGWEVAERSRRAGHITGFVDLQQIGFLDPALGHDAGNHRLKAANLAAVWAEFHRHGARRLVVVGQVADHSQVRRYLEALPAATVMLYRLHAGPEQLGERIRHRGLGGGPPIAGDELRGRPPVVLAQAREAAVAQAAALDRADIGDLRIDTDGRSAQDIAQEIITRTGW